MDCQGKCLLNTPCINFVSRRCKIRKTASFHRVFLVKLESFFLIFNTTSITRFISGVTFRSQLHMDLPKIMASYKKE